jgi:hypothetical protein
MHVASRAASKIFCPNVLTRPPEISLVPVLLIIQQEISGANVSVWFFKADALDDVYLYGR